MIIHNDVDVPKAFSNFRAPILWLDNNCWKLVVSYFVAYDLCWKLVVSYFVAYDLCIKSIVMFFLIKTQVHSLPKGIKPVLMVQHVQRRFLTTQ